MSCSRVLALLLLIGLVSLGEARRPLLETLFDDVLDGNHNGFIEYSEVYQRLHFMADGDDKNFAKAVSLWVSKTDLDQDNVVSREEFLKEFGPRLDNPERYVDGAPEQVHISLTTSPSEIVVVWVTFENNGTAVVEYGASSGQLSLTQPGESYSYNAGFFGWEGMLHKARLVNLQPETKYYYRVGNGGIWSPEFNFRTAPAGMKDGLRYLAFGDMGTFMPFGLFVTDAMVKSHAEKPYDMTIHLGDISYAGTGSTREWQIVWDIWSRQVEPLAAYFPYMTTLGNHEKYYNFTAFKARLPMQGEESGGYQNYYYSFDYGGVHFLQTCSEDYAAPYQPGSVQYEWIRKDLEKANANRGKVPWIIVTGHRPYYGSTDAGGWEGIRQAIEPLLKEFNVDIFLSGHIHAYERTFPVYNYEVDPQADPNRYVNPKHPVHIQIGTAGALVWERWTFPKPEWSAFRQARYGYSHFEVVNSTALHYQFFSGHVIGEGELADDFWIVKQ